MPPSSAHVRASLASLFGILATGCPDPATKDPNIECTPLPGEPCDSDAEGGGGDDEIGNDESDGDAESPKPLEPGQCLHNTHEDYVGFQYQCEGDLYTTLAFNAKGGDCPALLGAEFCSQKFTFGTNFQPYAAAEVIACCGEYDYEFGDTFKLFCAYDMYQQLCITLAERLESAIKDDQFGPYDDDAAKIQTWIADHYAECFDALKDNNSGTLPDVISYWELGSFGELENVVVHIDAGTQVHGGNLPVSPDEWISCNGASGNNDQVFEDAHSPTGPTTIAVGLENDLEASLIGPPILRRSVTATTTFEAKCMARGCPRTVFSHGSDSPFTLEELDLFTNSFTITDGTWLLEADRAQLRLWKQAVGHAVIDPPSGGILGYEIPAGEAHFLLSGVVDVQSNRFMGVNSTSIWVTPARGNTWTIDSFEIEYEDGNGELWLITVDESRWK